SSGRFVSQEGQIMRTVHFSVLGSAFLAIILAPSLSYGASQLAAGAATSARPTAAYGTQLYYLQLSFDPEQLPSFNVDGFQLSVQYDYTKLDVTNNDIQFIAPFTETQPPIGAPGTAASFGATIDTENGIISNIAGQAP